MKARAPAGCWVQDGTQQAASHQKAPLPSALGGPPTTAGSVKDHPSKAHGGRGGAFLCAQGLAVPLISCPVCVCFKLRATDESPFSYPGDNSLSPRPTFRYFVLLWFGRSLAESGSLRASLMFHNRMHSSELNNHKQMTAS